MNRTGVGIVGCGEIINPFASDKDDNQVAIIEYENGVRADFFTGTG